MLAIELNNAVHCYFLYLYVYVFLFFCCQFDLTNEDECMSIDSN